MLEREAKRQRRQLEKELGAELRRKDREALERLRAEIAVARAGKKSARGRAVVLCRSARVQWRTRSAELRRDARKTVNDAIAAAKMLARSACQREKDDARAGGLVAIEKARRVLAAERRLQKEIRDAGRRIKKSERVRRSSAEARRESDDEVRANIPAELVGVFDQHGGRIRGSGRKSRTEAFLEWAEEHPGKIVASQQKVADRELKRLLKEEKAARGEMRKAGRYRRSAEALSEDLADVPF